MNSASEPSPTPQHDSQPGTGWSAAYTAACIALVLLVIANAVILNSSNGIIDDAYIFFRYVDNMLAGHGLTWNPGELGHDRVEGYTSFLYVMLLAVPRALGAEPVASSHLINIGLFIGVVAVAFRIMQRTFTGRRWSTLITPLLLASSAALGQSSRTGLEQMLFAFLVLVACNLHLATDQRLRSRILGGAAFGLVVLTRPEGLLAYGICASISLWDDRERGIGIAVTGEVKRFIGLALVVLPHLAWRLWYYGEPLPNTYYAKVGYSLANIERGLIGGLQFLTTFRGALPALALIAWAIAPPSRTGRTCAALLVGWIGYAAFFLGLSTWVASYTVPIDWLALMTLGYSVTAIINQRALRARLPLAMAGAFFLVANASPSVIRRVESDLPVEVALVNARDEAMINGFIAIGEKLREIASPGDTVAVGACGAIPYLSGLVTYDTLGLNDKHIARQPVKYPGMAAFGHEKGDGEYIGSKLPTYLIPLPAPTDEPSPSYINFSVTFSELTAIPKYRDQYEFRYVELENGQYFNYFERTTGR
ncbi:MAG: arabinofuranosyltransferase [Chlamydiales bacterium]|jgi:arabinofuranosyltransferase